MGTGDGGVSGRARARRVRARGVPRRGVCRRWRYCEPKWSRCWRPTRRPAALPKDRRSRRCPRPRSRRLASNTRLAPGSQLGSYEIMAPLGAGGMGEVYRARDATLNRDVAVKVLPELFAHDRDRLARFKREAQILAALNHPNIVTVFSVEEAHGVPLHHDGGGRRGRPSPRCCLGMDSRSTGSLTSPFPWPRRSPPPTRKGSCIVI